MVGAEVRVSQSQVDRARETIDRMQAMVDSGTLETLFRVTEVRLNTGLEDAMFQD